MKHFTIQYEEEKRKLTIFYNGKVYGGMIGKIAEKKYYALKAEIDRIDDYMNQAKAIINGHKTKTPKI